MADMPHIFVKKGDKCCSECKWSDAAANYQTAALLYEDKANAVPNQQTSKSLFTLSSHYKSKAQSITDQLNGKKSVNFLWTAAPVVKSSFHFSNFPTTATQVLDCMANLGELQSKLPQNCELPSLDVDITQQKLAEELSRHGIDESFCVVKPELSNGQHSLQKKPHFINLSGDPPFETHLNKVDVNHYNFDSGKRRLQTISQLNAKIEKLEEESRKFIAFKREYHQKFLLLKDAMQQWTKEQGIKKRQTDTIIQQQLVEQQSDEYTNRIVVLEHMVEQLKRQLKIKTDECSLKTSKLNSYKDYIQKLRISAKSKMKERNRKKALMGIQTGGSGKMRQEVVIQGLRASLSRFV
eukprot:TRINITY_DN1972_c0_g1_i1.p1 TRINITY_DN1972_c0_g1~~TRINITY_DN1972_c0_g1_i1.p1  ORF type:complete len:352 (-),score=69.32 TRINITY_DN1972_c0_g1_i1:370-1425(-)